MRKIPSLLALCLATAGVAAAQELYTGSSNTLFERGDPVQGEFVPLGACGGSIQSMAEDFGEVWIGDVSGRIYHFVPAIGFPNYAFDAPDAAAGLVVRGGALWIGGEEGVVYELDQRDGAVLQSWSVGVPISALLVHEGFVYAGSPFGVVFRRPLAGGSFAFWGTCGGAVNALAADETHLVLADPNGNVYRIAFATGQLEASFHVDSDATAMVVHQGVLLVGGTSGAILRVDRHDGMLLGTLSATPGLEALALAAPAEPGTPYCYGIACPCANDDVVGGCANHLGHGASAHGSGTTSVAADDFVLTTSELPANGWGVPYMGSQLAELPFGDGLLCTGGGYPVFRFPARNAGAAGTISMGPGVVEHSAKHFAGSGGRITAGTSWVFQVWYRNPAGPCGGGFNTSNGYVVTFAP